VDQRDGRALLPEEQKQGLVVVGARLAGVDQRDLAFDPVLEREPARLFLVLRKMVAASSIRPSRPLSLAPSARKRTINPRSPSSVGLPRSARSMVMARSDGTPRRVSMARASSSAPGYGSTPARIHFAAAHSPSKSVWQQMVSTGPARSTSSGVTISGQAPCSALVARKKRGSSAYSACFWWS
jgi:hypothetical protein